MKPISKKLQDAIAADKRVCDFSDERDTGDGIWLYTVDGYYVECKGLHTLHAENSREMLDLMKAIGVCDCVECVDGILRKVKPEQTYKGTGELSQGTILTIDRIHYNDYVYIRGVWGVSSMTRRDMAMRILSGEYVLVI